MPTLSAPAEKVIADKKNIHTVSVFVSNKPGVLVRVALVFARRGYNIDSLVVSPAQDGRFSRMTITAKGDPKTLDQIIKQLSKLIDVVHASEHFPEDAIEKELALIKVKASVDLRAEIFQLVDHFKSLTVDITDESMIIQVTGGTEKLDAFIGLLKKYGITEIVRTGKIVMARGQEMT